MRIEIGLDEVGRGCWAGPLVAVAVAWPVKSPLVLTDSKKLSAQTRQQLTKAIIIKSLGIGWGWISPRTIDDRGLSWANRQAMRLAYHHLNQLISHRTCSVKRVVIDGPINYLSPKPQTEAQVKADDSIPAVMAAGIVGKTIRDQFMALIIDKLYNNYGFDHHKGYGTTKHRRCLRANGPLAGVHRLSYKPCKESIFPVEGPLNL